MDDFVFHYWKERLDEVIAIGNTYDIKLDYDKALEICQYAYQWSLKHPFNKLCLDTNHNSFDFYDLLFDLKSGKEIKIGRKTIKNNALRKMIINGITKEFENIHWNGAWGGIYEDEHFMPSMGANLNDMEELKSQRRNYSEPMIFDITKHTSKSEKSLIKKKLCLDLYDMIKSSTDNVKKIPVKKAAFIYDILYKTGFIEDDDFEERTETEKFDRIKRYFNKEDESK